ncbi:MAG TPA: flagellar export protein FliJ [Gemmatimonadales bacterium]|nr:flagellar export protein FliJ [Gemmatimonadales bacterium]
MKQFTFRLERLLQLREAAEKERARQLGEALREEEERREALRASQARLAEARGQLSSPSSGLTQAGTLRNLELSVEMLAGQARSLEDHHQKSLERVEEERTRFEQARVARRVIERLREHRKEAWGVEANRVEQVLNDEAGQRAHGSREQP